MNTPHTLRMLHTPAALLLLSILMTATIAQADQTTSLRELQQTVERLQQELRNTREEMETLKAVRNSNSTLPSSQPWTFERPESSLFSNLMNNQRPMLGVVLSSDRDANGVRLASVTPDGPADHAGLRAGDRLTSINGQPLTSERAMSTLFTVLSQSEPDDQCKIDYVREGKTMSTVVTLSLMTPSVGLLDGHIRPLVYGPDPDSFRFGFSIQPRESLEQLEGLLNRFEPMDLDALRDSSANNPLFPGAFHFARPITGLELKALNEDLADYFHTTRGVLVLSSDRSRTPLRGGDVVMTVDDEPVNTPFELLESLSRLDPGEIGILTVMRHAQPMTVQIEGLSLSDRSFSSYSWRFPSETDSDNKESK